MTLQEIQEMAGHREVSPWVVKLVGDAVAKEREACALIADSMDACQDGAIGQTIRARSQQ